MGMDAIRAEMEGHGRLVWQKKGKEKAKGYVAPAYDYKVVPERY